MLSIHDSGGRGKACAMPSRSTYMSMSEFEKQQNIPGRACSSDSIQGHPFPADFTEEDFAFAAELHAHFSPEEEDLPPYYVQTLLDVDDQRFVLVERGFEQRTTAHVFRRLKLRRRLFSAPTLSFSSSGTGIGDAPMRRSILTLLATFMLVMLFTVAFTGASFASGMAI